MGHKPDIIRAVVFIFAVGLVITGFTSLQASEDEPAATSRAAASATVVVPSIRD